MVNDEFDDASEPDSDEFDFVNLEPETTGTETEDDIADAPDINYGDVVLAPSDWTVGTILDQLTSGSFELDPDFQRRNAWTSSRQSKFIESLMLGLPIPQIIFAETEEDEDNDLSARYLVIDGKQRLLSMEAFFSVENPLQLQSLTVLKSLNGLTRSEIEEDPKTRRYVKRLSNRTIRTVVIRRWPSDSFLHLVFHRINHQTLALSAQELRQALHPGPFTRFADKFAGDSDQLHEILGASRKPDFRMRDVELFVRFVSFRTRIEEYRGNLKKFLDECCANFNVEWPSLEADMTRLAAGCNEAIDATRRIFGPNAFRRHTERGVWETRFNRAVFDSMMYFFSEPSIADAAERRSSEVVEAFADLSRRDRDFARSLSLSTKTVQATADRIQKWGEVLENLLGELPIEIPRISESGKRIFVGRQ
jgi:uncharacterized protein DUF262